MGKLGGSVVLINQVFDDLPMDEFSKGHGVSCSQYDAYRSRFPESDPSVGIFDGWYTKRPHAISSKNSSKIEVSQECSSLCADFQFEHYCQDDIRKFCEMKQFM